MKETTIYDYLDMIVMQPVNSIGRASNMLWLGLGAKIQWYSKLEGKEVEKSTYALHIQSAWRMENRERKEIIVASSDMYSPKTGVEYDDTFDWEIQGNNLFDEKSQMWLKENQPIFVKEYKINLWGDLLLLFSNGDKLHVFVGASDNTECWRVFAMTEQSPHLLVTGLGYSVNEDNDSA